MDPLEFFLRVLNLHSLNMKLWKEKYFGKLASFEALEMVAEL